MKIPHLKHCLTKWCFRCVLREIVFHINKFKMEKLVGMLNSITINTAQRLIIVRI